ncbi:5-dehydro-2-deoxygluconokinase [Paenibacillus sp. GP183]|uniref:5-dehydro-2-deoxygluconokinase n=1 Tax=Paenibacillus sp. GP183 TaxID=1882751 RepID=UPI0008989DD4|nr:5-dehydro-2-deoxygluconokinase [Paenibacillus sp. GP183]SEB50271.1 5-dehydro-2-deoxygluconokinase [Paenibacillus sp. GP183]
MNVLEFNQEKRLDFISIGRVCIDLNANEINRPMEQTMTFTKYVGGSPANICIGMARLGMKTSFIGKVANDQMGRFIVDYLQKNQIDATQVVTDHTGAVTGLAFTEIKSPTDCSILMYRDNAADLLLSPEEVSEDFVAEAKVVLISGTALAQSPSREAVFLTIEYARKHGAILVFDLDYRPYTWKSREETATYYNLAAEKCDVILGTREEFDMMERFEGTANDDETTASKWFRYNAKIVVIKHGKDGSIAYTKDGLSHKGSIFPAKVIKTFGAGDSYAAGFLYGLMQGWEISDCMAFGGAAASIVISSHSCSDAMPTVDQVNSYMQQCRNGEMV